MKDAAKDKPLYSTRQNVLFTLSNIWKWDKPLVFISAAQAPLKVLIQLSGLLIVRLVITLIETNSGVMPFIYQVSLFSAGILILNIIGNILTAKIQWRQFFIRFKYIALISEKNMDADFQNIESPDGMDNFTRAMQTVNTNESATQEIINIMIFTMSSVFSFITLFSVISTLSPLLLAIMVILTAVQYFINKAVNKWHYKNTEKWTPIDRKLNYINRVSGEFERAKDIRLYGLKTWLRDIFAVTLDERTLWYKKLGKVAYGFFDLNQSVIQLIICNGLTFLYLIRNVSNGMISIAAAVFYLSAVGILASVIMDVLYGFNRLNTASLSICHLRKFLDMPDRSNRGKGAPLPGSEIEIEFASVSYAYPKSETNAVNGMSFKINKGEKIAIVGKNGAGKTTLVKLISGLYKPSNGKIIVNGHEISEYNRDGYFSLISAVFQDIYLFPVSVAQNIALCEEKDIDEDKLNKSSSSAGLKEKIDSLPDGKNTNLIKSVLDNAIELSGGEKQKLALARALYKDGSLLILDEPTAALDPIAENEMYLKYSGFTKGKTSVFISHRLSSTRFCDRIFFIDEGKIAETGSHDELMALNGLYAEVFDIQSHYYKESAVNNEIK